MLAMYTKANMDEITSLIQVYLPEVDSIYLLGSYSKEYPPKDSDEQHALQPG